MVEVVVVDTGDVVGVNVAIVAYVDVDGVGRGWSRTLYWCISC